VIAQVLPSRLARSLPVRIQYRTVLWPTPQIEATSVADRTSRAVVIGTLLLIYRGIRQKA